MCSLEIDREALQSNIIDKQNATTIIQGNWPVASQFIENWWKAYQSWESTDTFNTAVAERRMTMRSFGSNFKGQLKKTIPMNIAEDDRFYANSKREPLDDPASHRKKFESAVAGPTPPKFGWTVKNPEPPKQYANPYRGLDTSPFEDPNNFVSREQKYKMGLHDLSVKLLVPNNPITNGEESVPSVKEQSHHKAETSPHFCFLPLSKPEDQYIIYKLIQYAKQLKTSVPELDAKVRGIRASMTRVKLSHHYDMGTGYTAVPTPDRSLPYKVTFSAGNQVKLRDGEEGKTASTVQVPMTLEKLRERQKAYFEHHANVVRIGNEFVIAMRRHNGDFPVYAYYDGKAKVLKCFDIDNGERKENGKTIDAFGHANW